MEMTIREVYNSTLLNIYNNAVESIKVVNLEEHNLKVSVYWNYKWCQPVIHIPQAKGYPAVIHGLGKDLGWYCKDLEWSRYE